MFSSFMFLSLPSPLSKINKHILGGGFKKFQRSPVIGMLKGMIERQTCPLENFVLPIYKS